MIYVKDNNLEREVNEGKVLVDFFATWCGPCQMLTPVLEKISEEENDVKIVKVNIDEETKLAVENGVEVVPTMILYDNGKILHFFNIAVNIKLDNIFKLALADKSKFYCNMEQSVIKYFIILVRIDQLVKTQYYSF